MRHSNNTAEALVDSPTLYINPKENDSTIYWLQEGANYFGRDAWNHILYPGNNVALFAGILFLKNDQVLMRVAAGQKIIHNNKPVDNVLIYAENTSLELKYGTSTFRIVRVGKRFGLSVAL